MVEPDFADHTVARLDSVADFERIAVEAYGHAQGLSLAFHQTRRTGALNRVIDRGVASLDYLIRFLAFNIGPTLIELAFSVAVPTPLRPTLTVAGPAPALMSTVELLICSVPMPPG